MRYGFLIGIILSIMGCGTKAEHDGFTRTHTGLEYRLISLGTSDQRVRNQEMVQLAYSVESSSSTSKDTIWVQWDSTQYDTSWVELIRKMRVGDSAEAFLRGIKMDEEDTVQTKMVRVRVIQSISKGLWKFSRDYWWIAEQLEESEKLRLVERLNTFSSDSIHYVHGVWVIHEVKGFGPEVIDGDQVFAQFSGKLLSGKKVDETRPNEPFGYMVGEHDQVISGMDVALREVREGGRATVIIPSCLAYGKSGSSTGIIGPNEPLIYEVEVKKVIRTTETEL